MTQRVLKGGGPLRVRPAETSDAEQLVELLHRADEESPFLGREPGESRLTAEMERGMIEDLDGSDSQVWLVAETEGRIIGLCSVGRVRHTRRFRHRGEVMLVVARDSWGQGAGSALLEDGIAWARRQGLLQLELEVVRENERAVRLYTRAGFQITGTRPRALRYADGAFADEYLMVLPL